MHARNTVLKTISHTAQSMVGQFQLGVKRGGRQNPAAGWFSAEPTRLGRTEGRRNASKNTTVCSGESFSESHSLVILQ